MTNTRLRTPQLSRRSFLQFTGLIGGATLLGTTAACAGPTGKPTQDTLVLGLNRSLVSLDNKLNQFDAAVTAQRGVRQGLTRIGDNLTPQLVLADRFESTGPTEWTVRLREGIRYSDGTPVLIDDVTTAMQMYQQVSGSFVAPQFPEWPTVVPIDDRTFILRTNSPVPVLDSLMSNILITPAAANEPNELQSGIGSGPFVVSESNRAPAITHLSPMTTTGARPPAFVVFRSASFPKRPAASSRFGAARSTSSTRSVPIPPNNSPICLVSRWTQYRAHASTNCSSTSASPPITHCPIRVSAKLSRTPSTVSHSLGTC